MRVARPSSPHASWWCSPRLPAAVRWSCTGRWSSTSGQTSPRTSATRSPQSWQVAWDGHALAHQPLDFFQSNQFWPLHDTLAFSDALVGYAPGRADRLGSGGRGGPLRPAVPVRLRAGLRRRLPAGARARARARRSGGRRGGVRVRALPARAGRPHAGDLERRDPARVRARPARLPPPPRRRGWSRDGRSPTWQLSLGFTLGLPLAYLLATVWADRRDRLAAQRGRPRLDRGLAIATVAGAAIFVAAGLAAQPAVRAGRRRAPGGAPNARATVEAFSGPPWIFLVAPDENLVWGGATSPLRDGLENIPEKTLFPGLVILALAIAGLSSSAYPRWLRSGLGVGVVAVSRARPRVQGRGRAARGRIASSTSCCRGGRRSGFPGGSSPSPRSGSRCSPAAGAQRAMPGDAARRLSRWGGATAIAALLVASDRDRGKGASLRPVRQPGPARGAAGAALRRLGMPAPQLHLPAERAERQPPLPAVVDRRVPGDRQRALEPQSRLHRST